MSSKEYEELEKRYQELFREKRQLEMKLEKVSAEYLYVQHRLNNESIVD
jgi:predicted nuclease with TOPRIM domain